MFFDRVNPRGNLQFIFIISWSGDGPGREGGPSSVLTFAGPVGGTYQIGRSPDLASWTPVGSPIVSTTTQTSRTVAVPAESREHFFRVNRTR